jgi:multiple sugar transport system substrate-binding protein
VTIDWPDGAHGQPLALRTGFFAAVAVKGGGHVPLAKEFVRFLVEDGWLAHWLDFAGERMLPPMPKLLNAPFWLAPSDPPHALGHAASDPAALLRLRGCLR